MLADITTCLQFSGSLLFCEMSSIRTTDCTGLSFPRLVSEVASLVIRVVEHAREILFHCFTVLTLQSRSLTAFLCAEFLPNMCSV